MDFQKQTRFLKDNKWIITIFFLALIIRVIFIYSSPIKWWDETVYTNIGYDLSKNFFDYSLKNSQWSDFIPVIDSVYSWPNIGFRAPLLPYVLAILYSLNLKFLINFFIPIIGALSIFLIYIFGKELFNKRAGLYAAIFLALIPLHVYYSSKILTDVFCTFFIILTFISFWIGYEKNKKSFKILFGIFLALSILSRYTAMWIIPVFLLYFIIRDKNINFIKDKYLWYSIIIFFIVLSPLFIYSQLTYSNPLGAFIHGLKASTYWGGQQNYLFFFKEWINMFSVIGFILPISLISLIYKKQFKENENILLLTWTIFFLVIAITMPHKEERLIIPIIPAICLICGYFISKIKKYTTLTILIIFLILLISNFASFYNETSIFYNTNTKCFKETTDYLNKLNKDIKLINENPPIFFYYTKKESTYYPNPINEITLINISSDKKILFVYTKFNSGLEDEVFTNLSRIIKEEYNLEFNCSIDSEHNFVYSKDF